MEVVWRVRLRELGWNGAGLQVLLNSAAHSV